MGQMNELVNSIKEDGLLEPIVVRPVEAGFEVVAGNRRFKACKMLNIGRIPCHIVELDDREAFEISLIENVQRETMNPIDEAMAFKRYMDDYGYGAISDLARKIGKSHTYVSRRIRLLSLPKNLRDELVRRRTSTSIVQELLSLKDREDVDGIAELIIQDNEQLTHREVRKVIKHLNDGYSSIHADDEAEPGPAYYSTMARREQASGRTFAKTITALKLCMARLDVICEHIDEDDWLLKEVLTRERRLIHGQVDELMNLKRRMSRVRLKLA